jgi:hypothetical protein
MLNWIKARSFAECRRLGLLAFTSLLGCLIGFIVFEPKTAVTIVHRAGYFWILSCTVLFAYALSRLVSWRDIPARFRAGGWQVVLLIAVTTAWTHVSEPHGLKVVNDEILLISASQRMHDRREAATVARAYPVGTEYTIMQGYLDKRPMLYPFLVSVLHDFTGYRPGNAFVLNALLTPLFLALLYRVVKKMVGREAGLCAILVWMTLPLFVQITNGAGFELLNLVMILGVTWLGLKYVETRTSEYLTALCLGMVLLAQVRYESVLFVVPVGAVILYGWVLERRLIISWGLVLTPLLLVIYPLQANVVTINPRVLQLKDRLSDHGIYSLQYFYDNVGRALNYALSTDQAYANSHLIAVLGGVGASFILMLVYRQARLRLGFTPKQVAWFIFVFALFGQAFLMLCYFWGAYDDYITVRLSLPTQLVAVLAFIYVYPDLVTVRSRWTVLGVACAIYFIGWTMPVVGKRGFTGVNYAAEFNNWCRAYISRMEDRNVLVLDPASRVWSLYEIPCLGLESLASKVDGFIYHHQRRTFGDYLIIQRLELANAVTGEMQTARVHDFGKAFELVTLKEVRYSPTYVMRLSRMVSLDESALREWAKNKMAQKETDEEEPLLGVVERVKYAQEWMRNLP